MLKEYGVQEKRLKEKGIKKAQRKRNKEKSIKKKAKKTTLKEK